MECHTGPRAPALSSPLEVNLPKRGLELGSVTRCTTRLRTGSAGYYSHCRASPCAYGFPKQPLQLRVQPHDKVNAGSGALIIRAHSYSSGALT